MQIYVHTRIIAINFFYTAIEVHTSTYPTPFIYKTEALLQLGGNHPYPYTVLTH
jgi:hypothetical protein